MNETHRHRCLFESVLRDAEIVSMSEPHHPNCLRRCTCTGPSSERVEARRPNIEAPPKRDRHGVSAAIDVPAGVDHGCRDCAEEAGDPDRTLGLCADHADGVDETVALLEKQLVAEWRWFACPCRARHRPHPLLCDLAAILGDWRHWIRRLAAWGERL